MASVFWNDFKRFFFRGLAAVLPTLLTVMIIVGLFNFVQNNIGKRINHGIIFLLTTTAEAPAPRAGYEGPMTDFGLWADWWNQRWYLQGVGFVVVIIIVYFIGKFFASFMGRYAWRMMEQTIQRTPLIKQIYPSVKQVTDFFLSEKKVEFSRVVAVEYPRKGIWSLGLVTGPGLRSIAQKVDPELLTIFIPSSPTPFTGYTITVRRDEVIDLPLSIDEALRFTVSAGVVLPPSQLPPGGAWWPSPALAGTDGDDDDKGKDGDTLQQ